MPLLAPVADPILLWLMGQAMPAPPAALYMSLHAQADPAVANEVTAQVGGRVRLLPAMFSTPRDSVGVPGREIANTQAVVFSNATTDLTIRSFAIWTLQTGGNMLLTGDVIPDVLLRQGDPAIFSTGDMILRIGRAN